MAAPMLACVIIASIVLSAWIWMAGSISTTLEGPFAPQTVAFDTSLPRGSPDLPHWHPLLVKRAPSIFPDQIALALSTPDSMWLSWVTGDSQIGPKVTPLDPSTVASEVHYGLQSGNLSWVSAGSAEIYSQIYPYKDLLNYTSGIIHHVRIQGLAPETMYYYRCGDAGLSAMSEERSFKTLPYPGPDRFPSRIAVMGDLGLTYNSSSTLNHVLKHEPDLLLMVGDLSYANQYITRGTKGVSCYSCEFPDSPARETYQPHWDAWGRFMEPLVSRVPMMVIEGNHEIEPQIDNVTFASYKARFAVPHQESDSNSKLYYSFDAGGIHFIMLGAYVDYNRTSKQFLWLKRDLEKVNREVTPWLIAAWHPPWYNSYRSHYREVECMRMEMEALLYEHGVDAVFSGHVHAYERCNRVYNYELNSCGPIYVTVGDGGNIEKVDVVHADDDGQCPTPLDSLPEFGGICPFNFSTGPAAGKYCWETQPEWSAFRDGSFGHGILEVINSTYALWTWHRNQDSGSAEEHIEDQIYLVRTPDLCPNMCTKRLPNSRGSQFYEARATCKT